MALRFAVNRPLRPFLEMRSSGSVAPDSARLHCRLHGKGQPVERDLDATSLTTKSRCGFGPVFSPRFESVTAHQFFAYVAGGRGTPGPKRGKPPLVPRALALPRRGRNSR